MTRRAKRHLTDHKQVAANCRQAPGEWQHVRAVATQDYGRREAWRIENAYDLPPYQPAGAFQARAVQRDMDTAVEARWLGAAFEDALRRKPATDTQEGGA